MNRMPQARLAGAGARCPSAAWLLALTALAAHSGCQRPADPAKGDAPAGAAALAPAKAGTPSLAAALPGVPTVTFAMPRGDQLALPAMGAVAFDQPVVPLSAVDVPGTATQVSLDPPVPLRTQWMGTSTLGFWPTKRLAGATTYKVAVAGVTTASGAKVADSSWTFSTPPATVAHAWPRDGADEILPTALILLAFDQQVDPASVQAAAHLEVDGKPLAPLQAREPTAAERATWAADDALKPVLDRLVVIKASGPLPAPANVALIVGAGVTSKEGPLPSTKPFRLNFSTLGPMEILSAGCAEPCDPDSWAPVSVQFNNTLPESQNVNLDKLIAVSPSPGPHRISCWGRTCQIVETSDARPVAANGQPAFFWKPGTEYTLSIQPGVVDKYGQKLAKGRTVTFTMGHRQPDLTLMTNGSVAETAQTPHRLAVTLRNLKTVEARAKVVDRSNLAAVLKGIHHVDDPTPVGRAPAQNRLVYDQVLAMRPSALVDQDERRVIEVDTALGGAGKTGAVAIQVSSPDVKNTIERLIQVTDLHLLAKLSKDSSVFWVTSLATGKPMAGVDVAVQGGDGKEIWRGKSNADGLVTGPGDLGPAPEGYSEDDHEEGDDSAAKPEKLPNIAMASLGTDWTFMRLDSELRTGSTWDYEGYRDQEGDGRGYLFVDKNVYKLGETVHMKGIVRRLGGQGLVLPKAGATGFATLHGPTDQELGKIAIKLSEFGTFSAELPVSQAGGYGSWQVKAEIDGVKLNGGFEVLVYRTPKFKSEAKTTTAHVVVGEVAQGSVSASYYSGGPLAAATVVANGSGWGDSYAPPGWTGYEFGGDSYDTAALPGGDRFSGESKGQLDDKGLWTWQLPTDKTATRRSIPVEVELAITDPNGQPLATKTRFWIHPAAIHGGLQLKRSMVEAGQPMQLDMIATDHLGKAVAGVDLEVAVVRRVYKQAQQVGIGGAVDWSVTPIDEPVGGCKATSGTAAVPCAVNSKDAGLHLLTLTAKDSKGRISRARVSAVVYGKGSQFWDQSSERSEMLVADQKSYKVGETAKILIKNPLPGARALVSIERASVLETRMLDLPGATATFEVPILPRHQPNFFVAVAIMGGRAAPAEVGKEDTGAPQLKIAYLPIQVDTADRHLKVEVKPAQPRYRPQQEVTVDVQLSDLAGKPVAGEVTLWAVDEGVLALTGHATPDPMETLLAPAYLGVRSYATIEDLIKGKVGDEKGQDGGGGGFGVAARGDFRDVPVWLPDLKAGPDGKAQAKFKLPDNLTTFRVMAVAVAGASQGGSGQGQVQVDKPLMLLTTWPRQVHVGDEFEVALVVRNRSEAQLDGLATLLVKPEGGQAALVGEAQKPLKLAKDAGQELVFRVKATAAGKVKLAVLAKGGAEQDGVEDTVEIVDPAPTESVATWGQGEGSLQEALQKNPQARPGVGGLQVQAAATPLIGLTGALQFLVEYPYGCTEQVASQLLALLWLEKLAKSYDVLPDQQKKSKEMAQLAVDKLQARRASGSAGLALWPEAESPDTAATAWSLRVLHQAKQAGYRVDEGLLRDGAAWLRTRLDAKLAGTKDDPRRYEPQRALVLSTLALLGQPAAGYLDELFAKRAELPLAAQLLLAEAAAADKAGGGNKAHVLVEELTRSMVIDAATAHLADSGDDLGVWSSEQRINAQLLGVMLQVAPAHPMLTRLTRWLLESRRDERWGTTQENAWALQGLGTWMTANESAHADFGLQVLVGGKQMGQGKVLGRALDPLKFTMAHNDLPDGLVPVVLQKDQGGVLHYQLRYTYALPPEADYPKNRGLFVKRLVIDEQGRVQPQSIARGQQVLVAVVVAADRDRPDIAIVDQLPAGLEPVEGSLATGVRAVADSLHRLQGSLLGAGLQGLEPSVNPGDQRQPPAVQEGSYDRRELAGREVRWFVNQLPQGVHIYTYVARAAVRGQFIGRGVKAEGMYRPDVFGTSGPNRLGID